MLRQNFWRSSAPNLVVGYNRARIGSTLLVRWLLEKSSNAPSAARCGQDVQKRVVRDRLARDVEEELDSIRPARAKKDVEYNLEADSLLDVWY